ncbi:MarR family winged helix-turn-helix transcriptional regulator [Streptomyces sp. NPDC048241]|uniref:MarR family winged helix-turn-helix transcriptional regulator n=1 Tax=Streptomyces sp. NPDC048241 TaxID=3365521 RepID=UPI003717909F
MSTRWLDSQEMRAWVRLVAVLELLPGVLDAQLRRDADLTHFDYHVLVVLSQAREGQLRMTALADRTHATLPRLSHVVRRLEDRGLVARSPCPDDKRATDARLTEAGREKLAAAAPGHVATARHNVIDALTPEQLDQLATIADAVLERLDPEGAVVKPLDRQA